MSKKIKLSAEVICLSDDDDGDSGCNDITALATTPSNQQESSTLNTSDACNKDICELAEWNIDRKDIIHIYELPTKYSNFNKNPFEIRCSAIRFGIVEFTVDLEVILMKETEFEMRLSGGFLDSINMKLAYTDIIKLYFSFQSQKPAALIQVRSEFARLFGKYIPTSDEKGSGFDPKSNDERRRHIIFYLKQLTPDMETIHASTIYHFLKKKCPKINICCINASRADELHNLARYGKIPASLTLKPKKQLFILSSDDLIAKTVGLNNNTIRFDLTSDDLNCLNEGEYLNDNIIDFYLQYIYYERLSDEDRKRTYIFNSFFFTRLTQKSKNDNLNVSEAEQRYSRIKRWLRDIDIFNKDYLIVPIIENAHWYIVIIQNHNNVPTKGDLSSGDEFSASDDNKTEEKVQKRTSKITQKAGKGKKTIFTRSSAKSNIDPFEHLNGSASDEDISLSINIDLLVGTKLRSISPAIIIFDSLRIASKNRVATTLREFLQLEYGHKKAETDTPSSRKVYSVDTIPTIEAGVPQQRNHCDCGLYILQYVESFFLHHSSAFSDSCEQSLMGSSKREEILNVIKQHVILKNEELT